MQDVYLSPRVLTPMRIRVGTRGSRLALWQAEVAVGTLKEARPGLEAEVVTVKSAGDAKPSGPIVDGPGVGVFVRALDQMILDGKLDCAVHSLKDMPTLPLDGIGIAAVLPRGPREDVVVSRLDGGLDGLGQGARVGTSSPRRAAQFARNAPHLRVVPLRGNLPTRFSKLNSGAVEAVVVAAAGVERLGLSVLGLCREQVAVLPLEEYPTAAGQGTIAITCREGSPVAGLIAACDHRPTRLEVETERRVMAGLGAGCTVPAGICAGFMADGGNLRVLAEVLSPDGKRQARHRGVHPANPAAAAGRVLAALREQGADAIVQEA